MEQRVESPRFIDVTHHITRYSNPVSPIHRTYIYPELPWSYNTGNGLYVVSDGNGRIFITFPDREVLQLLQQGRFSFSDKLPGV